MKIGAENKKQVQWMIALLALAILVGIYNFVGFGSSSAASSTPATSSTGTQSGTQPKKPGAIQTPDSSLDPRFRWDLLAVSQNKKYENGRNIFRMEEAPPPTTVTSVRQHPTIGPEAPPTPTPTPPPPPIPLKFYGFASKPSEPKKVFLDDEGEVFVARQGEIVERRYKVIQINNTSVVIEDALNNNRQTIQMTAK